MQGEILKLTFLYCLLTVYAGIVVLC